MRVSLGTPPCLHEPWSDAYNDANERQNSYDEAHYDYDSAHMLRLFGAG